MFRAAQLKRVTAKSTKASDIVTATTDPIRRAVR
jgi:hypothetical protein